jgi:hypothetical protein
MSSAIGLSTWADEVVYGRMLRSTVLIVNGSQPLGTGSVIDVQRRLVLTNFHVVEAATAWQAHFAAAAPDGSGRPVQDLAFYLQRPGISSRVVAKDAQRDLALLELSALPAGAAALPLAAASPLPGSRLHLVGNGIAVGALFGYEDGTVRAVSHQRIEYPSGQVVDALLVSHDLPTNPGDSGSPIVNDKGELVAVNHSTRTEARMVANGTDVSEIKAFLSGRPGDGLRRSQPQPQPQPQPRLKPAPGLIDGGAAPGAEGLEELQRLMADGPNRQQAIRDGVTSRSGVLRMRTLQTYFRYSSPQAKQAIMAALMGNDGATRLAALETLLQMQRFLAQRLQQLQAALMDVERQGLDEAQRRQILGAAMLTAHQIIEVTDAIAVAQMLPG